LLLLDALYSDPKQKREDEMSDIKPRDMVQVISGGPRMTVTQVAEDMLGEMTAWCVWFDGSKKMDGTFPVTALKVVSDSGPAQTHSSTTRRG
jgi:uncharacterized protein YodC (DUF2158 family)